ncbi:HAD family phosphatase [Kocuria rhizophila]|nr:HAD family phosphatase [Kocuria rhizophila]
MTIDRRTEAGLMGLSARDISLHRRAPGGRRRIPLPARQESTTARGHRGGIVGASMDPLPERWRRCARGTPRPVAVAGDSTRAILDRKMHAVGLADVLRAWVSAEDVPRGKPAHRTSTAGGGAPGSRRRGQPGREDCRRGRAAGPRPVGSRGHRSAREPMATHFPGGVPRGPALQPMLRAPGAWPTEHRDPRGAARLRAAQVSAVPRP